MGPSRHLRIQVEVAAATRPLFVTSATKVLARRLNIKQNEINDLMSRWPEQKNASLQTRKNPT